VGVVVLVVPAGGELREQHRQHRHGIQGQRDRDDTERERQHGDAAFLEERGEHPLGQYAGLLRTGRQQNGRESQAELAAMAFLERHRLTAQVMDASMLQDDQHHLGQQHAEKDDHAAGLEQQNADDRAGIEQEGAGHRHDEHVVHVQ